MTNKQENKNSASAGIKLNNGKQVVEKYLEAEKAAAENLNDANLASLAESTITNVVYRPLCSLDGDDSAM